MRGFFVVRIVDLVDNKLLLSLKSVIRYLVHKEKVALVALLFHVYVRTYKPDSVPTSDVGGDHLSCLIVTNQIFAVQVHLAMKIRPCV
jgi:hypothetical protein